MIYVDDRLDKTSVTPLRALARRPMYAAITILVLAIAIGANTTVFSVLNGLFLRPLPYPEATAS